MAAQIRKVAFLAIGILVSGAAIAADNGFYIGASAGQGRPNFDTAGASPAVALGVDSSGSAYKAFGGYQINKYFGAEASYVSVGSFNVSNGGSIDLYGWGISLVGTLPVGKDFSLLGRAGVNRMRERMNATGLADNTTSPTYGVGIKYDFNANFSGRIEAERILRMGSNNNTISSDANMYTIGLGYKF